MGDPLLEQYQRFRASHACTQIDWFAGGRDKVGLPYSGRVGSGLPGYAGVTLPAGVDAKCFVWLGDPLKSVTISVYIRETEATELGGLDRCAVCVRDLVFGLDVEERRCTESIQCIPEA